MRNIEILDTTLRDGAQAANVNFSSEDKLTIANLLANFGMRFVELGNPESNKKDLKLCTDMLPEKVNGCDFVSFSSTKRKNTIVTEDASMSIAASTATKYIVLFGKSSASQAEHVLGVDKVQNLEIIRESIAYLTELGKMVIFDAEHFFDGFVEDGDYALEVLNTALLAGAIRLVLCDTRGATLTNAIYDATRAVIDKFPSAMIGIHCHNDLGLAVANSLAAVQAGACHVQGTLLGFGERCGNANLAAVIPTLQLKMGYDVLPLSKLEKLTELCNSVADITNIPLPEDMPYVGRNAFTHKAGMHCDGVIKANEAFEHVNPLSVGNIRKLLLSELSGKSILRYKLAEHFPILLNDEAMCEKVLKELKDRTARGYSYDACEASLFVTVASLLDKSREFYKLISYKVIIEQPVVEDSPATATVKIRVKDSVTIRAADGDGPVHALDKALRSALSKFYPEIANVSLIDYKVRVIDPEKATRAKVRVLITSTNGKMQWSTVGVSTDIIEASWEALSASLQYLLLSSSES